jgi:hypothetical protein
MNTAIKRLNTIEIDSVAGGIALPPEPTFEDYIRIAEEAQDITLWRLSRYP